MVPAVPGRRQESFDPADGSIFGGLSTAFSGAGTPEPGDHDVEEEISVGSVLFGFNGGPDADPGRQSDARVAVRGGASLGSPRI